MKFPPRFDGAEITSSIAPAIGTSAGEQTVYKTVRGFSDSHFHRALISAFAGRIIFRSDEGEVDAKKFDNVNRDWKISVSDSHFS